LIAAVIAAIGGAPAVAQQLDNVRSTQARQASFGPERNDGEQTVRLGRRVPRVGDRVKQSISLEMRLTTSLRQANELIERSQTMMHNQQRRIVTTTQVDRGHTTAVTVRYLQATKQIDPLSRDESAKVSPPAAQAVQGKTYHCRRDGGEDGKLIVLDAQGQIPPVAEFEIVAQNMEMVGRVNPLAGFLAGRSIAVGETIQLPKGVADRVFNLGERYGEVTQFDLTLQRATSEDGLACAEFLARVEAASNDSSQMRLQVEGPLVVEVDSCRVLRTDFSGPIGMSEMRGSYSTAHQLIGTGQLKMSIASTYHDAPR